MNKHQKLKHLDIQMVYFTSEFMGHACASDICEKLVPTILELGFKNVLQLLMDGPNVNWKVFGGLQKDMVAQTRMRMLQTGNCGIHVLHNAFHAGCIAAGWDLEETLSRLCTLFLDCPARHDDFTTITGSTIFPLKFCTHRWLENIEPAERAIKIIPDVVAYCTAAKSRQVTEPTNKSFHTVQKAIQDPLLVAELHFFIVIAREIQQFLTVYQTDRPMPSISSDLYSLLKSLMSCFLIPEVVQVNLATLAKVDVIKPENQLSLDKLKVGFTTEKQLRSLTLAADKQKRDF